MVTKFFLLAILLFITLATIFSKCTKIDCARTVYNFKIDAQVHPDFDSIQIGDTIWLEIKCPINLIDIRSNQPIEFNDASNLGTAISFVRFTGGSISEPGAEYAANNFNFFLLTGQQVNNRFVEAVREYLFVRKNNMYQFRLAVIPHERGIYSMGLNDAANVFRHSDKCTKAYFEIDFTRTNQHLYFLQNNRPGYVIEGIELTHLYCFKVY